MGNVVSFNEAVRAAWEVDFKARWKKEGKAGTYTDDIWNWEEMLVGMGWSVDLYGGFTPDFSTFVDFDQKFMINRNVKAYHTKTAMAAVLDKLFSGATGRWLFYWEEVHDEAHMRIRDGKEYEGSDMYGTTWYSMELYVREVLDSENLPTQPVEKTVLTQ